MTVVIEITSQEQFTAFTKKRKGVILYGTDWCEACHQIKPMFERIAKRYEGRVLCAYADVEKNGLSFDKVPVLNTYFKGEMLNTMIGANIDGLKELIKEVLEMK